MALARTEQHWAVCDWCEHKEQYDQDIPRGIPPRVEQALPEWYTRGLGHETNRGHTNMILCPNCKKLLNLCYDGRKTPRGTRFRALLLQFWEAEELLQAATRSLKDDGVDDHFFDPEP